MGKTILDYETAELLYSTKDSILDIVTSLQTVGANNAQGQASSLSKRRKSALTSICPAGIPGRKGRRKATRTFRK